MNLNIFHNPLNFSKFSTGRHYRKLIDVVSLFIFIIHATDGHTAFDKLEMGAAPLAMGNAIVAVVGSPYAIYYNPAAIRVNGSFGIALSYQNIYELKDVGQVDLIMNFFAAGLPFSFAVNRFGNSHYTEFQGSLGGYYELGNQCSLGASIQVYHLRISGYGQQTTWGSNIGIVFKLLPSLTVGAMTTNINQPRIAEIGEKLPQTITLGCSFEPLEEMRIAFAIYRDIHFSADFRAGISYQLSTALIFRSGVEDAADTISIGIGIIINKIVFDYALSIHQVLGLSHTVSVNLII
jgi:hypothetical protein